MKRLIHNIRAGYFLLSAIFIGSVHQEVKAQKTEKESAYLFTYFTGNTGNEESIRFAVSTNGYAFKALNGNKPVIDSKKISSTGGVRDPHILRGADGKSFYMVVTDMVSAKGWDSNRAMVLLKSTDLIHWTSSVVNIQKKFAGNENLLRVWAPQTIYDAKTKKYMLYWSMKHGNGPDIIYYAYANAAFTDLETEPKQLFFSPTKGSCIDGDIIYKDGKYNLFFKTEGDGNGIKKAVSDRLTEGYTLEDRYLQQTKLPVEGSGIFKLNNNQGYILMYDMYTSGKYQFTKTQDLEHFSVVDQDVSMDFHPRHGTVLPITNAELQRLLGKWYHAASAFKTVQKSSVKANNIVVDTMKKTVYLPLMPNTGLKSLDPKFSGFADVQISPKGAVDFSKGAVVFTVKIANRPAEKYTVTAVIDGNPVLKGFYADPEIIYSNQQKKFYLYPTSDGFDGWSGNYFKTFSSTDLVNWTDEGKILDLPEQVSWGKRNAWAPTIAEKNINGKYKYFYYFTAAQKVGVAVADHPAGPFTDSGRPIVASRPKGIKDGQEIDPDVFTDPQTNESYLYWGNGYMAVAKLHADMVSIDSNTIKVITPTSNFREGTEVIFRKGKYYFFWSEDDTRSPNYQVAYGTSDRPDGKIILPKNNVILQKDEKQGIYGTGHNSVIQIPGKDEWYIVYHRFTRPNGITMGDAAGFNREVCIDKLEFDADGNVKTVKPTIKGISPVN